MASDKYPLTIYYAFKQVNSLVTSWSEISRLAAMEQQLETVVQGELVV